MDSPYKCHLHTLWYECVICHHQDNTLITRNREWLRDIRRGVARMGADLPWPKRVRPYQNLIPFSWFCADLDLPNQVIFSKPLGLLRESTIMFRYLR